MNASRRRWFLRPIVIPLAAAVVASLGTVVPASALPVTTGSLTFSGDVADYLTGGQAYAYSTATGDTMAVNSRSGSVAVEVQGADGAWWYLTLTAAPGQELVPGTYSDAVLYDGTGPAIALAGNGRGCNVATGTFTINEIQTGPHGYVTTLDATFEHHCEGSTDAARGEVRVTNPPAPSELRLDPLVVAATGTANTLNGNAVVNGTVSCTKPTEVSVGGTVTQVAKRTVVRAYFSAVVACVPGAPARWTGTAVPTGSTPFVKGAVEVAVQATAPDHDYGAVATASATAEVTLRRK